MQAGEQAGLTSGTVQFEFDGGEEEMSALLTELVGQGFAIASFSEESGNLEDVFLHVTKGIVS